MGLRTPFRAVSVKFVPCLVKLRIKFVTSMPERGVIESGNLPLRAVMFTGTVMFLHVRVAEPMPHSAAASARMVDLMAEA